ncbi:hypothetical protein WJX74_002297 [Apatococcus lobatus]|uniref:Uncharacterized protein n=1 Tax=Apatococcus lobatus TaxID=904363 RepID=A0AAW1Q7U1_9CHLO
MGYAAAGASFQWCFLPGVAQQALQAIGPVLDMRRRGPGRDVQMLGNTVFKQISFPVLSCARVLLLSADMTATLSPPDHVAMVHVSALRRTFMSWHLPAVELLRSSMPDNLSIETYAWGM